MADLEDRKLPQIPRFENEGEEAQWWFDHREELGQDMVAAARQGRLGVGTARRASEGTVRLDPEDVELAKTQAERRGLAYQDYVKMVVHRALLIEEKSA